jgi:hypothetical protein
MHPPVLVASRRATLDRARRVGSLVGDGLVAGAALVVTLDWLEGNRKWSRRLVTGKIRLSSRRCHVTVIVTVVRSEDRKPYAAELRDIFGFVRDPNPDPSEWFPADEFHRFMP